MPRPRTNDPLGVSDNPKVATDPARLEASVAGFNHRRQLIEQNYNAVLQYVGNFNRSLEKMKRGLARKRRAKIRGERAHPAVETLINKLARDQAEARTGIPGSKITRADAEAGARKASEVLKPFRGRARNEMLRFHVEAMMALLQQTTGVPVLLTLNKDNLYDPQAVNWVGDILVRIFQRLDPAVAVTTLASIVKNARRKYAGKRMRFYDYFPFDVQIEVQPDGSEQLSSSLHVEEILPNIPIYFP